MNDRIRDRFTTHDGDDSDFFAGPDGYPFVVVPPAPDTDAIVFCTKRDCLYRLVDDLGGKQSFGAIARYGLPTDREVDWLRGFTGSRRLLFLGDADPVDLLTFAWLRERLPIEHHGLSDSLLTQCGVRLRDDLTIRMRGTELAAMPLVTDCLGDLSLLLGPDCADLLASGDKIEVEALLSFASCTPAEMQSALLREPETSG